MALEMRMWIFFAALGLTAVTQSVRAEPKMPADYVRLRDVTPQAVEHMRYAGPHNFTGKRVNGYDAPVCWLRADAAAATELDSLGWRLAVYDCYRPTRAAAAFLAWAKLPDDCGKQGGVLSAREQEGPVQTRLSGQALAAFDWHGG